MRSTSSAMGDPFDVDSPTWVTLRQAMSHTNRTRFTIARWVKAGHVRTAEHHGVRAYCLEDLVDAERLMHRRQQATRRGGSQ